jgi:hypothetical protein
VVRLAAYTGSVAQQFSYDAKSGQASVVGEGGAKLCVDVAAAPKGGNKPPALLPCAAGKKSQQLGYAAAGPYPKHFVLSAAEAGAACLDVDGGYNLGSVALSLCTTTHPLYTRLVNIIGAYFSETTM